jgi:hypothetical protein
MASAPNKLGFYQKRAARIWHIRPYREVLREMTEISSRNITAEVRWQLGIIDRHGRSMHVK